MSTTPATATRSEFARLQGWKPSYITELAATGRLVLSPDGKRVLVPESLERIAATRDPARLANTQRHAAARAEAMAQPQPAPESPAAEPETHSSLGYNFQDSKAKREHFAALEAEASYRQKIKDLLDASEVRAVQSEIITVLRTTIEGIPYTMAPQLAATSDEHQVKAILAAEIEHALKTAADSLARLGKGAA